MKQSLFESRHQPDWQHFAQQLEALERGKADPKRSLGFAPAYRRLCQHLALAQARGYSSHLIDQLQQLAMRGHQQFYRHRSHLGAQLIGFVLGGFPRAVRAEWPLVLAASLLFFGSLIGMGLLVYLFPDLIHSVMDPSQVSDMETMYDPDTKRIGRFSERDAGDDWMMFGFYIMNNIGIAFQTYASGLLFGLGSLFFLLFNGLTIGAVAGHLTQIGYNQTFWSFVIGHGAFELTAIALAGAAGLKLGWALLAPGRLTRAEALRLAGGRSVQLVAGVILFLLIAAFIEAYWSSMTYTTPAVKFAVGAVLWLLVFAYLGFAGRTGDRRHAPD
ncbi:MAG: stage II sporulation protein M [Pseudomonadota bacterium]